MFPLILDTAPGPGMVGDLPLSPATNDLFVGRRSFCSSCFSFIVKFSFAQNSLPPLSGKNKKGRTKHRQLEDRTQDPLGADTDSFKSIS